MRGLRSSGFFAASLLLLLVPAAPAAAGATNLTLEAAVAAALRDNSRLRSMAAERDAMQARPQIERSLGNPMLGYAGMDRAEDGDWPDTSEKRFMIEQAFPGFGKRRLRAGAASAAADAAQADLQAMAQEVVMSVKETFHELQAVRIAVGILADEEAVIGRIEKVAETLYSAGRRTQVDVLKAQSERTLLKQKVLELEAREVQLASRLNALLDQPADAPLALEPAPLPLPADATRLLARASDRPEVLAERARGRQFELERRLMAADYVPDYLLGAEYRAMSGDEDMVMFSVRVELPIWGRRIGAAVREAEYMRASAEAAAVSAERTAMAEIRGAHSRLGASLRTLELYRGELIPQAEARLTASEAGYRTGAVDFVDLLESERFLLEARLMAAMTAGAVGMDAARLERAAGTVEAQP